MPTASVNGRDLFWLRRGTGEPLLLVQGMSGHHRSWGEPFLRLLEERHEVLVFDHRGVGDSGRSEDPFTIADLAEDAAGLLDALGLDRVHLLGISMGGMVAQEIALRHPGRLRTLTLGCTYAGGPGGRLTEERVSTRLAAGWSSGDAELAIRALWEANVSAPFAADPGRLTEFMEMAGSVRVPLPVIMQQLQAVQGHDTSARLGEIRVPTLVVHGDRDDMLPVENAPAIADRIPGARLEILEGIGHMFWWEAPRRSAELILAHTGAGADAPSAPA